MEEVLKYLKENPTFYLATCENDQPRVRPFGAVASFEGKLYITTNNKKPVFQQMQESPKVEICAMGQDHSWIRIEASTVHDDRREAREQMLTENPGLRRMYSEDDGLMAVLYLKDATATIASFGGEPKVIRF